jgi:uncharacterized DUF497 family protein
MHDVLAVARFEWDTGNYGKCAKHGVSREDVEAVLRGRLSIFPDFEHSTRETRFLGIGRTAHGRHVFVAFTLRPGPGDSVAIRPISARFMHRREILHYEAQAAPVAPTAPSDQ